MNRRFLYAFIPIIATGTIVAGIWANNLNVQISGSVIGSGSMQTNETCTFSLSPGSQDTCIISFENPDGPSLLNLSLIDNTVSIDPICQYQGDQDITWLLDINDETYQMSITNYTVAAISPGINDFELTAIAHMATCPLELNATIDGILTV